LAAVDERYRLSSRGWTLRGIDFSAAQVALSEGTRPYTIEQANVEDGIPFDDASLTAVYAGELIEHLYNPDAFLDECYRVLRPGGALMLTTPNFHAWYNRVLFVAGVQPMFYESSTRSTLVGAGPTRRIRAGGPPVGHIRLMNRTALRDLLQSAGFEDVAVSGSAFAGFGPLLGRLDAGIARLTTVASILVASAAKRSV
jgi:SAM-dependent methyltransferase